MLPTCVLARLGDRGAFGRHPGHRRWRLRLPGRAGRQDRGAETTGDARSHPELEARYAEGNRPDKALEAARRRFKAAPSAEAFAAVRAAQEATGAGPEAWPTLRAEQVAALEKKGDWVTLVDIHLADGAVGQAIAALEQTQRAGFAGNGDAAALGWHAFGHGPALALPVAETAERDYPAEAVAIYRERAERRIAERQRASYKEAAKLLVRARDTLAAAGREKEWREAIAALREQHNTLRALREELDAAGPA